MLQKGNAKGNMVRPGWKPEAKSICSALLVLLKPMITKGNRRIRRFLLGSSQPSENGS
jgi:hypothetical protein